MNIMKKMNVSVGKINKYLSVKVGLILSSPENPNVQQKFPKLIQGYNINGNHILNVTPRPFVTLDISRKSDKSEWNPNTTVNLNSKHLIMTIYALRYLTKVINTSKNLFTTSPNGELGINSDIVNRLIRYIPCGIGKTIKLQPALVPSEKNSEVLCKGCILFINSVEHYAYLTLADLFVLLSTLENIDLTEYAMGMISLYLMIENQRGGNN